MLKASDLFEFPESLPFGAFFRPELAPWEWLPLIKKALKEHTYVESQIGLPSGLHIEGDVFIHPTVKLPPFGLIQGPAYIGEGCELRPGVFIRGNVIVGQDCVLGNSCEFKNSLLLNGVKVPHFSYVGDSVLGNGSHLGAGVICSNLRLDQADVTVALQDGTKHTTNLKKLGALIGDYAEVGCNTVLNPGCILGKRALVMPSIAISGTIAANSITHKKEPTLNTPRID